MNKINRRLDTKDNQELTEQKPKENVRHFCGYCDKSYATKYALNGHINAHIGVKPFKCKLCDMRFPDPQSKKKHEMRHDSKRPYECDICLKGFYTRTKLKEHERIHTGERPYRLTINVLINTNKNSYFLCYVFYRCDVCDAYFRYKFNLYSHQFSKMHKENMQKVQKNETVEDSS